MSPKVAVNLVVWLALLGSAAGAAENFRPAGEASPAMVTRVYELRDLFVDTYPDTWGEDGRSVPHDAAEENAGPTWEELLRNVVFLVTDTVDTASWAVNGSGGRATIYTRWRQLIVTQSPANHRKLSGLLSHLRKTRSNPDAIRAAASAEDTEVALRKPVPDRELNDVPFADALAELRERFDLPIDVDYQAVEAAGIHLSTPVTVSRRGATAADAIALALRQPRAGRNRLVYFVQPDGRIVIRPIAQ